MLGVMWWMNVFICCGIYRNHDDDICMTCDRQTLCSANHLCMHYAWGK